MKYYTLYSCPYCGSGPYSPEQMKKHYNFCEEWAVFKGDAV